MSIKFIYSNNNKIGSRIISGATRMPGDKLSDVPSHFSVLVWDWIVIESTLTKGFYIKPYVTFEKQNKILKVIKPINASFSKDLARKIKDIANKRMGSKYDFRGAIYIGFRQLLNTCFGFRMPKENKWDRKNRYFCNEVFGLLFNEDMSMDHPNSLMRKMSKDSRFTEER